MAEVLSRDRLSGLQGRPSCETGGEVQEIAESGADDDPIEVRMPVGEKHVAGAEENRGRERASYCGPGKPTQRVDE